jgi:uncharacterized protein YecE (DUF72 family)
MTLEAAHYLRVSTGGYSARRHPCMVIIGTAGWALPKELQDRFAADGSRLTRYAAVFNGTEINSSFHRPHRASTYLRWAASVPDHFRFSVKMPKLITHLKRLMGSDDALHAFLDDAAALGERLACLLIQLPPSLAFVPTDVEPFVQALRKCYAGDVALEPRHESWFSRETTKILEQYEIARVAADPARVPQAAEPGGWNGLAYWRLHGSPRVYRSSYADADLTALAAKIRSTERSARTVWCIFDNTASGAAAADALTLKALIATS